MSQTLELEYGDPGDPILPAPSVKDQGAYGTDGSAHRLAQMRALTEDQRRYALAFVVGYAPKVFDRALDHVGSL